MKALVVCHKTREDLGSFESVLNQRGYEIDLRMGYEDLLIDQNPLEHDLSIFMGGPMGVYQANSFPYLNREIDYLKQRIEANKPTLGICLGAQMIAKSQGKDVYKGQKGMEIGWLAIDVNEEGMKTAVRHLSADQTLMMQWHGDTFDLPDNATLLASSDLYKNQAYLIGNNVMALQCHPEAMLGAIEVWLASGTEEVKEVGLTIEKIRADTQANLSILNKQCVAFFEEWLDQLS